MAYSLPVESCMHSLCICAHTYPHCTPYPWFGLFSKKSDVRIIWWVYREREGESDISLLGTDS